MVVVAVLMLTSGCASASTTESAQDGEAVAPTTEAITTSVATTTTEPTTTSFRPIPLTPDRIESAMRITLADGLPARLAASVERTLYYGPEPDQVLIGEVVFDGIVDHDAEIITADAIGMIDQMANLRALRDGLDPDVLRAEHGENYVEDFLEERYAAELAQFRTPIVSVRTDEGTLITGVGGDGQDIDAWRLLSDEQIRAAWSDKPGYAPMLYRPLKVIELLATDSNDSRVEDLGTVTVDGEQLARATTSVFQARRKFLDEDLVDDWDYYFADLPPVSDLLVDYWITVDTHMIRKVRYSYQHFDDNRVMAFTYEFVEYATDEEIEPPETPAS